MLTSYEIIQIDATVLIGLLILLTFQTFTDVLLEAELEDTLQQLNIIDVEYKELVHLLNICKEHVDNFTIPDYIDAPSSYAGVDLTYTEEIIEHLPPTFYKKCDGWMERFAENEIAFINLGIWASERFTLEYVEYGFINEEFIPLPYDSVYGAIAQYNQQRFLFVIALNIINLAMVIPFAMSAIIEARNTFWKKDNENVASKRGYRFMVAGFIMIVVGLIAIILNLLASQGLSIY